MTSCANPSSHFGVTPFFVRKHFDPSSVVTRVRSVLVFTWYPNTTVSNEKWPLASLSILLVTALRWEERKMPQFIHTFVRKNLF